MKCFVFESPMTWAVVGLACSIAAGQMGPDAGSLYLVALGTAAVALVNMLAPGLLRPGGRPEEDERDAR